MIFLLSHSHAVAIFTPSEQGGELRYGASSVQSRMTSFLETGTTRSTSTSQDNCILVMTQPSELAGIMLCGHSCKILTTLVTLGNRDKTSLINKRSPDIP